MKHLIFWLTLSLISLELCSPDKLDKLPLALAGLLLLDVIRFNRLFTTEKGRRR